MNCDRRDHGPGVLGTSSKGFYASQILHEGPRFDDSKLFWCVPQYPFSAAPGISRLDPDYDQIVTRVGQIPRNLAEARLADFRGGCGLQPTQHDFEYVWSVLC